MHAHLIQFDISWENKPTNFAAVDRLLRSAPLNKGDLVVLPEMFDTGFSPHVQRTSDCANTTLNFLRSLAMTTGCTIHGARTCIVTSGSETGGKGMNLATIIAPSGETICEYQKMHLFPLGTEPESAGFMPGERVMTYTWTRQAGGSGGEESLRVCPAICYDLRFPELFRVGMELGAEVFAVISSWPRPREAHRRALTIARAIENQAYVLSVNRTGSDPNLEYAGGTLAVGPRGDVLGELGEGEGVLSVEISKKEVQRWRELFPAWRERRGDYPGGTVPRT